MAGGPDKTVIVNVVKGKIVKSNILTLANRALVRHATRVAELTETFVDQRKRPRPLSHKSMNADLDLELVCLRTIARLNRDPAAPVLAAALEEFRATGIPPRPFADDEQGAA